MKVVNYLPGLNRFLYHFKKFAGIEGLINPEKIFIPLSVHQYLTKKGFKQIEVKNGRELIWEKVGFWIHRNLNFRLDFSIYSDDGFLIVFPKDSDCIACIVFDVIKKDCMGGFVTYPHKTNEIIKKISNLVN